LARQREKGRNLSHQETKIRILSFLYNKEMGENAHTIQFHAISGHTQEASRFKRLLEDLCELGRVQKVDMSHVTKGRVIYKITKKGRETIEHLRNPVIKEFLGLGEI
jgi:DNA-binding PadR family transcriptional regulator